MSPEQRESILKRWDLTEQELTDIVRQNPSMRGLMLGYVAEYKLRKMHFSDPVFTNVHKADDHDRSRKGDLTVTYKGHEFRIECKSLQTNSVKKTETGYEGRYQCDASDRRTIKLRRGRSVETTCLRVGEFDIIAVNLFAFEEKWRFAFALNSDLPRSNYQKYPPAVRRQLLATLMPVTLPLEPPYVESPIPLLERLSGRS
ncbi:MAG TPA: restriction endonuclease [bacterium]|nr:restriction endonuclease [bacterium]